MKTYRRLLGYLRPYSRRFTVAMVFMAIYAMATGAAALIVKNVLDDIFLRRDAAMLKIIPLVIIAIYFVKGLAFFTQSFQMKFIGQSIIRDLRNDLFDHILSLPLPFFTHRSTGSLMSRILNDVTLIQFAVSTSLASLIRDPLTIVCLVGVTFYRSWSLALIALVVFPAAAYPLFRFGRSFRRVTRKSQAKISRVTTLLHETIGGIKIVKAFGMEDFEKGRFHGENERLFNLYMKTKRIEAFSTPFMEFLGSLAVAVVVVVGGLQVIKGKMTTGEFFSFMTAMLLLYEPFKRLTKVNNATQEGLAAADRIFEIMDQETDIKEKPDARELGSIQGRVTFEKVFFSYGNQDVLKDIDLDVQPGEVVAFVGSSGVGKTTLLSLIPRFYDVTGGKVAIDGHDIRDVTIKSLRSRISLVTQETILFNDTIRSNISYGRPSASQEEIIAAARAAYAYDFILETPQGFDTVIGEKGVTLSGGERQRLSIARAILKNAPILILDEATSSLDSESEMLVQKALDNLMTDRTTLIIAHRLGTVVNSDRIVVLEGGSISHIGRHQDLMAVSEIYQRLYRLQFQEVEQTS